MLDTNHYKNSSCAFAEQIVAYLYDEANPQEKTNFESHLANCENCAEELSAFGFVRSAVQQWRTAEFSPMRTPAIEIPFEKSSEISVISTEKRSWFAGLRRLFTLNPLRTATAALAILVVCAGLTLFIYNFSGNAEIAENNDNKPPESAALPTTEQPTKVDSIEIARDSSADKLSEPETEKLPKAAAQNTVEKVSDSLRRTPKNESVAGNLNDSAPVRKVTEVGNINKTSVAKNEKLPKLADFDEPEDNSLRLSDLMAEVEDK